MRLFAAAKPWRWRPRRLPRWRFGTANKPEAALWFSWPVDCETGTTAPGRFVGGTLLFTVAN